MTVENMDDFGRLLQTELGARPKGSAVRAIVGEELAGNTAVQQAAADAVTTAIADRDLVEGSTEEDENILVSIRDAADHRTWLEADATTGGPSQYAAGLITAALAGQVNFQYVASGDSMTADAYGGGTSYPAKLATLLGRSVANNGSGGRRASEVAISMGGLAFPVGIPGAVLPAGTTPVACTPTLPDTGPVANRTFAVAVQGVACTLTYTHTTTSWTIARKATAAAATPVPKTGAVAIPAAPWADPLYVHILWGGRNNAPKSTAPAPVITAAQWCKDNGMRFLIVAVCNTTYEGAGSAGLTEVLAANDALRGAFPREYVEMRGRMISEGLARAGLSPTSDDTTAIADNRIPPALLHDGLHFNDAGRVACAAIIHNELTIRGLA